MRIKNNVCTKLATKLGKNLGRSPDRFSLKSLLFNYSSAKEVFDEINHLKLQNIE